jgi:hypothetical protein
MWKKRLFALVALVLDLLMWVWWVARMILDNLGRASAFDDVPNQHGVFMRVVDWFLQTPWYIPALLAIALTVVTIIYLVKLSNNTNAGKLAPLSATDDPSLFRISVGERGPFSSVKDRFSYSQERIFSLKIENIALNGAISNCKISILSITPQTEYEGPWILKEDFSLAAGDYTFIPLASYGEARNPETRNSGDSSIQIFPRLISSPKLSKDDVHTLTARATGFNSPACEMRCRLWVDEQGRFKIEDER